MKRKNKTSSIALAEKVENLESRLRQVERVIRILGYTHSKAYMSETALDSAQKRAHHFSNAYREVINNCKRYGHQFDQTPHYDEALDD